MPQIFQLTNHCSTCSDDFSFFEIETPQDVPAGRTDSTDTIGSSSHLIPSTLQMTKVKLACPHCGTQPVTITTRSSFRGDPSRKWDMDDYAEEFVYMVSCAGCRGKWEVTINNDHDDEDAESEEEKVQAWGVLFTLYQDQLQGEGKLKQWLRLVRAGAA